MLQEIFLSLSGLPSPIWEKLKENGSGTESLHDYVSEPEQAMLTKLSHLSQLHIEVKNSASVISLKHPSLVCRAVGSAITNKHLVAYRQRIVEVESSILKADSSHVGGYQIVPLSTLVADFAHWTRRLEWLQRATQFMKNTDNRRAVSRCSAASILDFLEDERHTGFTDLEDLVTHLLVVGQTTWMRSTLAWTLYGQLPTAGAIDFMIKPCLDDDVRRQCVLETDLIPRFVSKQTAENVLAIGNALRQLQSVGALPRPEISQATVMSLLNSHLAKIQLLEYPLNPSLLESTMTQINESISQHGLSKVLPLSKVLEVCRVLRDYMLLGRGEFAIMLIQNCDARISSRQQTYNPEQPVRKLGKVSNLAIKETELNAILSKTWADLVSVQGQHETDDDAFESAKQYLRLRRVPDSDGLESAVLLSTILPETTSLQLDFPIHSSLGIFLPMSERQQYSKISSCLLSIRRAQLRLSSLWTLTSHRRCYPTPLGPPISGTDFGRRACQLRRNREDIRTRQMRRFWSSMNKSLFFLNEYSSYLSGEVIRNSWNRFESWLGADEFADTSMLELNQASSSSRMPEKGDVDVSFVTSLGSSTKDSRAGSDPRTLARAHATYLTALTSALLLTNDQLTSSLKSFLDLAEHFVALFVRLSVVWQGLDLQEDDGVMDAFINYAQDEKDILAEMDRARIELENLLETLVKDLKDIERSQDVDGISAGIAGIATGPDVSGEFVPWRARTLDRLIMKLDFLYRPEEGAQDETEDNAYD